MSEERPARLVVLTGASGSGKSSIVEALRRRGFRCVEEIGRQIVKEQLACGGTATPWQDTEAFMHQLMERYALAYDAMRELSGPVFFDRALPECLGFARSLEPPERDRWLSRIASCRYDATVFFTSPWREIYRNDAERRHTFEQGVEEHVSKLATYRECGYTLVEVPRASVEARVDFMLDAAGL